MIRPPSRHASPVPALILELSRDDLEFRTIKAFDPLALCAPIETRLGRRLRDVVPHPYVDQYERAIYAATKSQRVGRATFRANGLVWEGRIIIPPGSDVVIGTAHRVEP